MGYKKKYKSHKKNYNNGLSKVKKDIKWLKKGIEFKHKEVTGTDIECNTTGVFVLLNGLLKGDNVDQRDGDEVVARRIMIRGSFENNGTTPPDCEIRVMIVRRKETSNVVQTTDNLLDNSTSSKTVNRFLNLDRARGWKVYADETFSMDTLAHTLIPFKFLYKLNHTVKMTGSADAESAMDRNSLYIYVCSTVAAGVNAPHCDFTSRFSYCDS